ncbi:hypothetical protein PAMA_015522 [Pampus argenteus]
MLVIMTSDPKSVCPPLCQILKRLCYSPVCCSVSLHLRRLQRASQSVLGSLQIIVGLLNVGLGAVLSGVGPSWPLNATLFPLWLGGLFIVFGIMCIFTEKCPSPCLVIVNVILNLTGAALAIATIVLYCINMANMVLWWWMCRPDKDVYWYGQHIGTTASPSPEDEACLEGKALILMLMSSVGDVLIVLSGLMFCLVSVGFGFKVLRSTEEGENKSADDPDYYKPLLEVVTTNPGA